MDCVRDTCISAVQYKGVGDCRALTCQGRVFPCVVGGAKRPSHGTESQ